MQSSLSRLFRLTSSTALRREPARLSTLRQQVQQCFPRLLLQYCGKKLGSSHFTFGTPISISEFPFYFGNSYLDLGVPIRFWELPFGFRSSYLLLGTPIRIWEFPFAFGNSHSDLGVPIVFWELPF
jgi:hypothetical protein